MRHEELRGGHRAGFTVVRREGAWEVMEAVVTIIGGHGEQGTER